MSGLLRRFGFDVMLEGEGGGGGAPPPAAPDPGNAADPPAPSRDPNLIDDLPPAAVTFTPEQQQEISRRMTAEKQQGARAEATKVAEALGMSLDEAKKFIEDKKAADDAAMSEADRKLSAAEAKEQKADERIAAATRIARDANIALALAAEGVKVERDEDGALSGRASRIVKLIDVADDADAASIKTAIDTLKADEPALFVAATPPPSGDPLGSPPGAPATQPGFEKGNERAKRANAQNPDFDPASVGAVLS